MSPHRPRKPRSEHVGPPGLEPGTYGFKGGMSGALSAHAAQTDHQNARNAQNAQVMTGRCFHDGFHTGICGGIVSLTERSRPGRTRPTAALAVVARGYYTGDIARELMISPTTVRKHLENIFKPARRHQPHRSRRPRLPRHSPCKPFPSRCSASAGTQCTRACRTAPWLSLPLIMLRSPTTRFGVV